MSIPRVLMPAGPLSFLLALSLVPASASGQESTVEQAIERFRLFTDCSPVRVFVEVHDYNNDLGLSEERVETAVRSRLRGARIYRMTPEALAAMRGEDPVGWAAEMRRLEQSPALNVEVVVSGPAYSVVFNMNQAVSTRYTGFRGYASTWTRAAVGSNHGKDPGNVLGNVAELMDGFIDDYLRVNDEACSR